MRCYWGSWERWGSQGEGLIEEKELGRGLCEEDKGRRLREVVGLMGRRGSILKRGVSESVKKRVLWRLNWKPGDLGGDILRNLQSRRTGPDMFKERPLLSLPCSDANSGEKAVVGW